MEKICFWTYCRKIEVKYVRGDQKCGWLDANLTLINACRMLKRQIFGLLWFAFAFLHSLSFDMCRWPKIFILNFDLKDPMLIMNCFSGTLNFPLEYWPPSEKKCRDEICQEFYTTRFSSQKFYTLFSFTMKCSIYLSNFFVRIELSV